METLRNIIRKKCLKCGYVRKEGEIAQEYECPKCGIVYSKYEAALKRRKAVVDTHTQDNEVTQSGDFSQPERVLANGIKVEDFILILTGIVILLNILFPPFHLIWEHGTTINNGYSFILYPPSGGNATVDHGLLLVQIIAFAFLGGGLFFYLRNSEKILFSRKEKYEENAIIPDREIIPEKLSDKTTPIDANYLYNLQPHPWPRYFARLVDNAFVGVLVGFSLSIVFPSVFLLIQNSILITSIIIYILMLPVEALFLSAFGYTPAKWLFGIQVLSSNGEKLSYSKAAFRSILVWIQGNAFGIPCVCLITNLFGYYNLTKNGHASWDEIADSIVRYRKLSFMRIIFCILAVFLVLVIYSILNSIRTTGKF
ncbi:MAG: RDD family protein [Candidatus Electrothrix sp. AUS3]|nr:RDD family protein [Candidatus Electrothrix gigas]